MRPRRDEKRAPVRSVAVFAKIGPHQGVQIAADLGGWLKERGVRVRFDYETAKALGLKNGLPRGKLPGTVDLVIVAGGDGTLLSVARSAAPKGIPLLGVNFGSLGFLTELQPDELFTELEKVIRGQYRIEERQTLRLRYRRGRSTRQEYALLNDAVITKSALARMIELAVSVDGEEIATYHSDGLILSTPTGSTAYNLSAGGPILDPRMRAFVISPICPHTMTYRPLVVPETVKIEVTLRDTFEEVYLTLDGQVGFPMLRGHSVVVDSHPSPVRLIRVADRTFFQVLRRKLRWGER